MHFEYYHENLKNFCSLLLRISKDDDEQDLIKGIVRETDKFDSDIESSERIKAEDKQKLQKCICKIREKIAKLEKSEVPKSEESSENIKLPLD